MTGHDVRRQMALQAFGEANKLRLQTGHDLYGPVCPYDLAGKRGLQVRFVSLASLEGAYVADIVPERVLIGSLRPAGRQRFTAAHELGHCIFGHGTHLDEVVEVQRRDPYRQPEELIADMFAGALLMPKFAIEASLAARGWGLDDPTPEQIYVLAGWFGVGYGTLIRHMELALGMLSRPQAEELLRTQPKTIRQKLLCHTWPGDVFVVDEPWAGRPLDLQVGDAVITPCGTAYDDRHLKHVADLTNRSVLEAIHQGCGRLRLDGSGKAIEVRVALRDASGLYEYRYDEDTEHVDDAEAH